MRKQMLLKLGLGFLSCLFFSLQASVDLSTPTMIKISPSSETALRSASTQVPPDVSIINKVNFDKTALNQSSGLFYLGAKDATSDANLDKYAVTRVSASVAGIGANAALTGKKIVNLTLFNGSYPTVTTRAADNTTDNIVYLIANPESTGGTALPSVIPNDSSSAPTNQIKALSASGQYVFAAVSAGEQNVTWETPGTNGYPRGISVMLPDFQNTALKVLDANNITDVADNKASQLSVKADSDPSKIVVAFYKDTATNTITEAIFNPEGDGATSSVDMFWDNKLQRLFVAMTDVRRDNNSKEGGVVSVVVGRIEQDSTGKNALQFMPIISDPATKFTLNNNKHIIGFYYNNSTAIKVSAKNINVMHTSTGKDYLILNSVVAGAGAYEGVYALPLISSDPNSSKNVGTVSGGAPDNTNQAFTVGTNDAEPTNLAVKTVTDIFVHGDSVFMCSSGSASAPQDMGIFQSSAIFDTGGAIVGWTSWQRVMGNIDRVWGGGIDPVAGDFYYLASETTGASDDKSNTVKITQWGTTDKVYTTISSDLAVEDTTHNLSSFLAQTFPQEEGGIFQIFDFDSQIDGFYNGHFSMMVVLGYSKVAIIQTGTYNNGRLEPITKFDNTNTLVFSSDELTKIAPLCCAEVSRTTATNKGFLFVGGLGGVAVLNKSGAGWASQQPGLASLSDLAGFAFTRLTPASTNSFANTRRLVCRDNLLYELTKDNLYIIDFSGTFNPANPGEVKINLGLPTTTKFSDCVLIPYTGASTARSLILGTTSGLYSSQTTNYSLKTFSTATKIGAVSDPAVHLNYISLDKRYPSVKGNLYVLFSSFIDETGKIYRYYVNGGSTTPIATTTSSATSTDGLFVDLNYFRGNFVTDCSFGYSLLAKGTGQNDLFHVYEMTPDASSKNYNLTQDIGINTNLNWYIGAVTKNSASGSVYVPGDWGLIVNE